MNRRHATEHDWLKFCRFTTKTMLASNFYSGHEKTITAIIKSLSLENGVRQSDVRRMWNKRMSYWFKGMIKEEYPIVMGVL